MDPTPIEKIIAKSGLRDVARALYDNQTAPCADCGVMTKCEAARQGRFLCLPCYNKFLRP